MEQPGLTIDGRYRLVKILNTEGGMGTIWVADDLAIGNRQVAVKFPLEKFRGNEEALIRFDREAELAVQIGGPNVIQILARGKTEEGVQYIVMELLEGQNLEEFIGAKAPCSLVQAHGILSQLFRVTSRIHQNNIVHRDIKSSNIYLVPESDGTFSVKLLDFGIAKQRLNNGVKSLTQDFTSIGSGHYMAPEQMVNTRTVGRPADLYAIGVVSYEMLTGRVPHEWGPGQAFAGFYEKVVAGIYPPATSLNPALPAEIDQWFSKALHPNPDPGHRFQTVEEMSQALNRIVARIPASTTTMQPGVKIAPAGSALPTVSEVPRLKLSNDHTHVLKERSNSGWMIMAAALLLSIVGGGAVLHTHQAEAAANEERVAVAAAAEAAAKKAKEAKEAADAAAVEAEEAAERAQRSRGTADSEAANAKAAASRPDTKAASRAAAAAKQASAAAETAASLAKLAASRASGDPQASHKAERARINAVAAAEGAASAASAAQVDADFAANETTRRANESAQNRRDKDKRDKEEQDRLAAAAAAKIAAEKAAWYTPTEAQRTAIVTAVKDTNAAEITAFRSLDGRSLAAYEEGSQLAAARKTIESLKTNNLFSSSHLLSSKIDWISVNYDGDRAKVHLTEAWAASFWDRETNTCKWREPEKPIPQTIFLHLSGGRWRVSEVKHDNPVKPERLACNGN